ncbi:MAG: PEGA domain-containing protein [Planctomycetes bacterium]|nr:PEGA domain-containing protein [Planctomycetota bacterium]
MKTITFGGNVIAALFKMFCGLILVIVALLDVSCATIVRGTKDTLVVESTPSGSIVTLSNGMVGKTPASFVVPRTKNLVVKIEHDGYEPVQVYVVPQAFSES